jgi:RNA polymerase-binding protein DksA
MPLLSEEELKHIEQQLRVHREALQTHMRGVRSATDSERYSDIAGTVHDLSDESFAELSTALSNASLGREADALREIEEALHRLHAHSYGYCVDCGQPIALERLRAYPTAKRCLPCQQHGEDRHGGKDPTPSL